MITHGKDSAGKLTIQTYANGDTTVRNGQTTVLLEFRTLEEFAVFIHDLGAHLTHVKLKGLKG